MKSAMWPPPRFKKTRKKHSLTEELLTQRVATALYSLIFEDDKIAVGLCWAPTRQLMCTIVMKNIVQ